MCKVVMDTTAGSRLAILHHHDIENVQRHFTGCIPPVCWQCMDDKTEVGIAYCVIAGNFFQYVLCRDTLQVQPKLP